MKTEGTTGTPRVTTPTVVKQETPIAEVAEPGLVDVPVQPNPTSLATLKASASVSRVTSSPYLGLNDEEILRECQAAANKWVEKLAKQIGIDPAKLQKLAPEIISLDQALKLKAAAMVPLLKELPESVRREIIPKLPLDILKGLPDDLIPPEMREQIKGTDLFGQALGGAYILEGHKTGVAVHHIRTGVTNPYEFSAHEENHGLCALLRSFLSEEELTVAVCEGLKDDITKGSTRVFSSTGIADLLYIPSTKMREEVTRFLEEVIQDSENENGRVRIELEQEGEAVTNNKRLTAKGQSELFAIAKRHPDFMCLFENEESAKLALSNLIETQLKRFDVAMGRISSSLPFKITIPDEILKSLPEEARSNLAEELQKSDAAKEFMRDSAGNFLKFLEGNLKFALNLQFHIPPSKADEIGYTLCSEERQSYLAGTVTEKDNDNVPGGRLEKLEAREKIYEPGGLGEKYVDSLCELRVATQDPALVKEYNKLHVARVKYSETEREIKKIIKDDEVTALAGQNSTLGELIQREAQLRVQLAIASLKVDGYTLRRDSHEMYYESIRLLQQVRCQIRDTLASVSPQSKLLDRFSSLLEESDSGLRKIILLEASSDEKCLDPRSRVTDAGLLDRVAELEMKISTEQQKANIVSLINTF